MLYGLGYNSQIIVFTFLGIVNDVDKVSIDQIMLNWPKSTGFYQSSWVLILPSQLRLSYKV